MGNKVKYKITVILTFYNLASVLFETLASLEKQNCKLVEVVLIDDGSTDLSLAIAKSFLVRNIDWRCISIPNQGVSHARNFGLTLAKGEYVLFLDGDDVLREGLLDELKEACNNSADVVVFRSRELDHVTSLSISLSWSIRKKYIPKKNTFHPSELKGHIFYSFMGWPWDKLFKIEFLQKNKLSFPSFHNSEDLVFVYKALVLSDKINILEKELIFHRVNRNSSLSNTLIKAPDEFKKSLCEMEAFIKNNPIIFSREKSCFYAWMIDYYLWGVKNTREEISKNEMRLLLDWYEKCKGSKNLFPFLRARILLMSNNFIPSKIKLLIFHVYQMPRYGFKRVCFRLISFIFRFVIKLKV